MWLERHWCFFVILLFLKKGRNIAYFSEQERLAAAGVAVGHLKKLAGMLTKLWPQTTRPTIPQWFTTAATWQNIVNRQNIPYNNICRSMCFISVSDNKGPCGRLKRDYLNVNADNKCNIQAITRADVIQWRPLHRDIQRTCQYPAGMMLSRGAAAQAPMSIRCQINVWWARRVDINVGRFGTLSSSPRDDAKWNKRVGRACQQRLAPVEAAFIHSLWICYCRGFLRSSRTYWGLRVFTQYCVQ